MMKNIIRSMNLTLWIIAAAAAAVIMSACRPAGGQAIIPVSGGKVVYPVAPYNRGASSEAQPIQHQQEIVEVPAAVVLYVSMDPEIGRYLVDVNGMPLYAFTGDEPDRSNCSAACRENWPPLVSARKAAGDMDINPGLIGSALLEDGSAVVTYNHMPLYFSALDWKPGLAIGQGWDEAWYLVSPDGEMIDK